MVLEMVLEMVMLMETYGGYGDGGSLFGDSGGAGGGGMYGNGMASRTKDIQYTQKTDVNSVITVSARDHRIWPELPIISSSMLEEQIGVSTSVY